MWKRIMVRVGRVVLSVVAAGVVQYATSSEYAAVLVPMLSGLGKWLREKGVQNVPF